MPSFRTTMMAIRASFTFLGIFATLLLTPAGAEEKPERPSQPSLIVTPASSMAFSGPRGGPFSPARLEFRVSSTTGIVNYSIRTPSWLTASSTFGTTDTRGVTITLTVNANASRLSPGAYGPGVAFTNVSNGQGSTTSPAKAGLVAVAVDSQYASKRWACRVEFHHPIAAIALSMRLLASSPYPHR